MQISDFFILLTDEYSRCLNQSDRDQVNLIQLTY